MQHRQNKYTFVFSVFIAMQIRAGPLRTAGQVSAWAVHNVDAPARTLLGLRYVPAVSFSCQGRHDRVLDTELSANILTSHTLGAGVRDASTSDLRPYRLWLRYSSRQWEVRLGLQKINFGTAMLLRPLMWFDRTDARDPLQLTDGVWGLLARRYFLNNANIWLWALYGNNGT